ncbi:hypothetical protein [Streptomyces sp. NBC_00878]|uniref:hypothetical protein n=1 Tax=Streptomyces sp. NBC_00878 TaxID=2975854 RepID=UPI0022596A51|nr:hypothetical protein [Streptomyces sp. NBC_00878]MCX4911846.1 hypothetical protein [Streptomyces sp. NBC_00878]
MNSTPEPQTAADVWNSRYPIGTPVTAYPGARPEDDPNGERLNTRTRSEAQVLSGHTAVVWVDGHSACIALAHVDPVQSADAYRPPAKYWRSDGAECCPHALPVGPGSCEACWDLVKWDALNDPDASPAVSVTVPSAQERRDRYAAPLYALMRQNGWDGEHTEPVVREMDLVLAAVLAVADAEQADTRAAVLREAATIVRSMDSDYALQEAAEHLDGLAVEADEEREAQANLDALAPLAEGAPLPDLDGPALYEKLVGMFSGPLPWPPDSRADLVTFRERIAEGLYAHDHPGWRVSMVESSVGPVYRARAVAVVTGLRSLAAVLPQPETQAGHEARPAEHVWRAELYDPLAEEWAPGTRYVDRDRAVNALTHARRIGPAWKDGTPTERRLVRATTTYTVEAVQPEPETETHVVADGSDDPEHVDDCPGCTDFSLTGHVATAPAVVSQPDEEADRILAYRSVGGRILRCLTHIPQEPGDDFTPLTSGDLPDGGICTFPDCGADVLIPQQPDEEA